MSKIIYLIITFFLLNVFLSVQKVQAIETNKLGIHILNVDELQKADELFSPSSVTDVTNSSQVLGATDIDTWNYVTLPFTLADIDKTDQWQNFFNQAKSLKIIPIIRLATEYSSADEAWIVPTKKEIIDQLNALSNLNWPSNEKYIIVYNEVNHAKEWGGKVDPEQYARTLEFVANWAHTEAKNYVVLPAAMDLAAPNSSNTMEAFSFLEAMESSHEGVLELVDVWNSHSYPNPGFASAPTRVGKNSLRGFEYELAYLKQKTGKDYKVMITETGWSETRQLSPWLTSYYTYAMQHIWSDQRVLAVTPFLLQGSPGPFEGFSFIDAEGQPTKQYFAFQTAMIESNK